MTKQAILSRALEIAEPYLDQGDVNAAFAAYTIELGTHDETRTHAGIQTGLQMLIGGMLSTVIDMRRFLQGFN